MLEPEVGSLVIAGKVLAGIALEDSNIEVGRVQLENINKVFPCHINGAFLEIIAETPVAEHLEHGVVVSIVSHLFQVVVFATDTQTLLCVGTAAGFGVAGTQNYILPLVHSGIGEHQCGVVLDYHRSRRHNQVALRLEILLVRVADFVCSHHISVCYVYICK